MLNEEEFVKYAFVLLLGPGQTEMDRLVDLIKSLKANQPDLKDNAYFVAVNDGNNLIDQLDMYRSSFNEFYLIENPLFGKSKVLFDRHVSGMIAGFEFVATQLKVDFVVKLDTDVLCINSFSERLERYFSEHPGVGIAGTYLTWPAGLSRKDAFVDWASRIKNVHKKSLIKNIVIAIATRKWSSIPCHFLRKKIFKSAIDYGYQYGQHIMGGSYAVSGKLIDQWYSRGYLQYPELFARSYLGEDTAISLLVFAAGYQLGCFNAKGEVFGVWYRQPEKSPSELYEMGYALIHSIKDQDAQREMQLRNSYRSLYQVAAN
jgi:hypothetical protein